MISVISLAHLPPPQQIQALVLRAWLDYLYAQLRSAEADYAATAEDAPARRSALVRAQYFAAEIERTQRRLPPVNPYQH